ncbi:glycosyltransferase family 87 protein [Acetobacter oeni]|nr:glycosyltransferase family 87 protein [Acetobacter oeni]
MSFGNFAFFYPPTFLLTCTPLALLPYGVSASLWLGTASVAYVSALRRILPWRWALIPILAFPGFVIDFTNGQNGLLTAALLGWSMMLMRQRPFVAGLCLGCLVIKPQLLVAAPVILLCTRQWRTIAGGIVSGGGLIVASWIAFGTVAWSGFFRMGHSARVTFEMGYVSFWKMQSVFTAVRLLHGNVSLAYVLQTTTTVFVFFLVGWLSWRMNLKNGNGSFAGDCAPEIALMIAALPFCTPFLLDYDLACLAFPMAWLFIQGRSTEWLPGEKIILFLAYIYLLGARLFGMATLVCPTPFIASALLLAIARRMAPAECAHAISGFKYAIRERSIFVRKRQVSVSGEKA